MTKNKNLIIGLLSLLFIFIYFLSRLQNLTSIPVFGDEAIYIRWSQIIKNVETLRFIPQTDGKQPLFMWLTAGIFQFFNDPLIAGRMVSIFAGFGSLVGIFFLSVILFPTEKKNKNPLLFIQENIYKNYHFGFLNCFLYLSFPFTFFFDRMSLPDNLLSFFSILSLFFSVLLAYFPRLDISLILGGILGISWLTKSPAIYFIALSYLTFFLINIKKINYKFLLYPTISALLAFAIYNILRLGPQFHMIAIRNKDYIWSLSEIIKHPLDPLTPHLKDTFQIYFAYISLPILISAIFGFLVYIFNNKHKNYISLLIVFFWCFLPILSNAAMAKVFTARYILYTIPSFIILISFGLFSLKKFFKNYLFYIFFLLFISSFNFIWIYKISTNPFLVKLPSTETGYTSEWTSGWGIKEASQYLIQKSQTANVIVGTEGAFGTLPDGLQIYTNQIDHLTVFGVGLDFKQIPYKLIDARQHGDDVYILMNKSRLLLTDVEFRKLNLIAEYPKPLNDKLLLLQLK